VVVDGGVDEVVVDFCVVVDMVFVVLVVCLLVIVVGNFVEFFDVDVD